MEGLMDTLLIEENTNVTFDISYHSHYDNKSRFLRSNIDFSSADITSKKLLPFIL
jgi:hypothetical protein